MSPARLALNTLAATAVALAATAVQARDYNFGQGSWATAGLVTGSFSGNDDDNDGLLELSELTAFSWRYQGSGVSAINVLDVATFQSLADAAFVFKVGPGADLVLGNDANEGISFDGVIVSYFSGAGPLAAGQGEFLVDPSYASTANPLGITDNSSSADIRVTDLTPPPPVSAIPEPSTMLLLAAGLGALGLRARRRA